MKRRDFLYGLAATGAMGSLTARAQEQGRVQAWPDATNTGIPSGTVLTPHTGDLNIKVDGAVYDALDIRGALIVSAKNVTVKRCRIVSGTYFPVYTDESTGTTIQDCEISGQGAIQGSGPRISNTTVLRCNFHGTENGVQVVGSNVLIQDCWVHDLAGVDSGHFDGVAMQGGFSNVIVRHCSIANNKGGPDIYCNGDFGNMDNLVFDNNLLTGSTTFTIQIDPKKSKITNVIIKNNLMIKGYYGYRAIAVPCSWTNNKDHLTGAPVP